MKKRGMSQSIWVLIGLVFGIIAIFILLKVLGILGGGVGPVLEQSAVAGFHTLGKTTQELINSPEYFKTAKMRLQTEEYGAIIAFNKNQSYVVDACGYGSDTTILNTIMLPAASIVSSTLSSSLEIETIQKPAGCGNDACLCYYKPAGYEYFRDAKISKEACIPFPEVDYFITFYYADWADKSSGSKIEDYYGVDSLVYKNMAGYKISASGIDLPDYYPKGHLIKPDIFAYPIIYGECDAWPWDQEFASQSIYIEKFIDPKTLKTYILIAADSNKEVITKRSEILQKELKDRLLKPEDILKKINDIIQNKEFKAGDYEEVKRYATLFNIYYGKDENQKENKIKLNEYVEQANKKNNELLAKAEEERAKLEKEIAQIEESPPTGGIPPGYEEPLPYGAERVGSQIFYN